MGDVLVIFFSVVVGLTLYSLWSFGYFAKVTFQKCNTEPMIFVYEKFIGPSQNVIKVIDDLYFDLLDKASVDTFKNIGVYYDTPHAISMQKCRSVVGCLLEKDDYKLLDDLKEKYKVVEIPSAECVTASYPFRSPLSISVAILRVYPKMKRFLKQESIGETPVVEVYDDEGGVINYYAGKGLNLPSFDAL